MSYSEYLVKMKKWLVRYTCKKQTYLIVKPGSFLPQFKQSKYYNLHYKKKYAHYVEVFTQSEKMKKLRSFLKRTLGAYTDDRVPVLFFETLSEFDAFLQESKKPHAGGRGSRDRVVICCNKMYKSVKIDKASINQSRNTIRNRIRCKSWVKGYWSSI